jgi:hypothetical protein
MKSEDVRGVVVLILAAEMTAMGWDCGGCLRGSRGWFCESQNIVEYAGLLCNHKC